MSNFDTIIQMIEEQIQNLSRQVNDLQAEVDRIKSLMPME